MYWDDLICLFIRCVMCHVTLKCDDDGVCDGRDDNNDVHISFSVFPMPFTTVVLYVASLYPLFFTFYIYISLSKNKNKNKYKNIKIKK